MNIGLIGFGNMGSAVIDGLLGAKAVAPEEVYVSARRYELLRVKAEKRGIHACANATEVARHADLVFLAPPADSAGTVLREIAPEIAGKTVVSFVSGLTLDEARALVPGIRFLSAIPSTPIRYGEGIVILDERHTLGEEERSRVVDLLSRVALVKEIKGRGKGVAATIAGCGPALTAIYLEALGDAGCEYGLSREDAYAIASQMLVGLGKSLSREQTPSGRAQRRGG